MHTPAAPMSVSRALLEAKAMLPNTRSDTYTPELNVELLLAHVLGTPRVHLYSWPDKTLTDLQCANFFNLLTRRAADEPLAYLTGKREFWSLELKVTPDVLIPRPETELLVELALERIPPDAAWRIADLGTGSGAIALALARERPQCRVVATDISAAALAVAHANARRLAIPNVEFRLGDGGDDNWCAPLHDERYHMIVSNPPYVADNDPHLEALRFEPRTALVGGADGLDHLRRIAAQARDHLVPHGWLVVEHGYDQGPALTRLLTELHYQDVQNYRDLAGQPRVSMGRCE